MTRKDLEGAATDGLSCRDSAEPNRRRILYPGPFVVRVQSNTCLRSHVLVRVGDALSLAGTWSTSSAGPVLLGQQGWELRGTCGFEK